MRPAFRIVMESHHSSERERITEQSQTKQEQAAAPNQKWMEDKFPLSPGNPD
jgi:hypothetical protein